jgi:serine protease Do
VAALDDVGQIETGDFVMAVGNAYQPGEFLWVGSVSSCGRRSSPECCDVHDCIHTTAVNPWNCGGPLVNLNGTIVGISTSLQEPAGFPMGIAVHASTARHVAEQLRSQGRVRRGWLGVFIHKISPGAEVAAAAGLPDEALAATVDYVVPHSSADAGGIRAGDVILKFAGAPFDSALELRRKIAATPPQQEVILTVFHAGQVVDRQIVIGLLPATPPELPGEKQWGVRLLGHLSPEESKQMGVDHLPGVVVQAVKPRRKAKELSAHDVILSVNEISTPTLEAFCREVSRLPEGPAVTAVTLEVSSNGVRKRVVIGE